MPTVISGFLSTYDLNANQIVLDVDNKIATYDLNVTKLLQILTNLNKKSTHDRKITWYEDEIMPRWAQVAASYTTTASTIVVATGHGAYFKVGSVFKVVQRALNPGEVMRVVSINGDSLGVTRAVGTTAAAFDTLTTGPLLIFGNSYLEAASAPTAKATKAVEVTNHLQITRNSGSISGTEANIDTWTEDDLKWRIKKVGGEHAREIEDSLIHGEANTSAPTDNTVPRQTKGIFSYIGSTNQVAISSGALTIAHIMSLGEKVGRYSSDGEKWLIGGSNFWNAVNQLVGSANFLRVTPETKRFGIKILQWEVGNVLFNLIRHPLFEVNPFIAAGVGDISRKAICLDMGYIGYRFLQNRDTKLKMNIQNPDVDGITFEYITEYGLQFALPKAHGIVECTGASNTFV